MGVDFIVFDLGLGDDPGLEGIGEHDVPVRHVGFQKFVEPRPVHSGFENHAAAGVLLDKVDEELQGAMIDVPLPEDAVGGIDDAKNAVSLVEIDSDKGGSVVGWSGLFHRPSILEHPFYRPPQPNPPANPVWIKLSCRLTPPQRPAPPLDAGYGGRSQTLGRRK